MVGQLGHCFLASNSSGKLSELSITARDIVGDGDSVLLNFLVPIIPRTTGIETREK